MRKLGGSRGILMLFLMIIEIVLFILLLFPKKITLEFYEPQDSEQLKLVKIDDKKLTKNSDGNVVIRYDEIANSNLQIQSYSGNISMNICNYGLPIYNLSNQQITCYAKSNVSYPFNTYLKLMTLDEAICKYSVGDYIIIVTVNGDGGYKLGEDVIAAMHDYLGIQSTPADYEFGSSYIAVSKSGDAVYSKAKSGSCKYNGRVDDQNITVISDGYSSKNDAGCSVIINGHEYATNKRGVNIVVYDGNNGEIVDSLAFDTVDDAGMSRNYSVFKSMWTYSLSDSFVAGIDSYVNIILFIDRFFLGIIIIIVATLIFSQYIVLKKKNYEKKINISRWIIIQIIITIVMIISVGLPCGYEYLKGEYEDVSLAQLIYHMKTNLNGTNWADFNSLFSELAVRAVWVIVLNICLFAIVRILKSKSIKISAIFTVGERVVSIGICLYMVVSTIGEFDENYGLIDYIVTQNTSSNIYEEYYVNPKTAKIAFPSKKKNLVYIYMESMENTYADSSVGGTEEQNYIPELTEIALDNECFNGNSGKLNGGEVLDTTGWTIAAMVGQTSGTPLNLPVDGNAYGEDSFLPGAYSLGQVLEDNGYRNCIMMGSEADFAGRKTYFEEHGNYEICDYNWAVDNRLIDDDYKVWWGYEDAKLFEFAKNKAIELSESNQPFNLSLLTVDTHPTDGYVCDDCEEVYNSQYANVIACSSKRVAEFISWLKEQDFYKDTVIVLAGDNLCMDASYFTKVNDYYNRTTYFCVINSDKKQNKMREFCTLDMFPTTLSALNCEIDGDMLGLGTDLYSERKTLTEVMGHDELNYQLKLNSKYYNKCLLSAKKER